MLTAVENVPVSERTGAVLSGLRAARIHRNDARPIDAPEHCEWQTYGAADSGFDLS